MITSLQAHSQVSMLGGSIYILRRQDFSFYYLFKKNFGAQKFWGGTATKCPPWLRACFSSQQTEMNTQITTTAK